VSLEEKRRRSALVKWVHPAIAGVDVQDSVNVGSGVAPDGPGQAMARPLDTHDRSGQVGHWLLFMALSGAQILSTFSSFWFAASAVSDAM